MTSIQPFVTTPERGWTAKTNPDRLVSPGCPDWLYSVVVPPTTQKLAVLPGFIARSQGTTVTLPNRDALVYDVNVPGNARPNDVDGSGNRLWVGPDPVRTQNAANSFAGAKESNGYLGLTVIGSPSTDVTLRATAHNQNVNGFYVWGKLDLGSFTGCQVFDNVVRGPLSRGVDTAYIVGSNDSYRGAYIYDNLVWGRNVVVPATYNGFTLVAAGLTDSYNGWANDGLRGGDATVRRNEIRNTGDGIGLTSQYGHWTIEGNWVHDGGYLEWTDPDDYGAYVNGAGQTVQGAGWYPGYPGNYTHADCIQFHRGKVIRIRGNVLGGDQPNGRYNHTTGHYAEILGNDDYMNTCIMFKQEVSPSLADRIEDVIIEGNLLGGGIATINHPSGNSNTFADSYIRRNRFMRKLTGPTYPEPVFYILTPLSGGQPTLGNYSNNVFDDTGLPVPFSPGA